MLWTYSEGWRSFGCGRPSMYTLRQLCGAPTPRKITSCVSGRSTISTPYGVCQKREPPEGLQRVCGSSAWLSRDRYFSLKPGLNGISMTVLLVGRLACGVTFLPSLMSKISEAFAGPSQLPLSLGEPLKLTRPSGQRGVGFGGGRCWPWAAAPGGACASTETAAASARLTDNATDRMTLMAS